MRLSTSVVLGLSAVVMAWCASCSAPAQPPYVDVSYQTRCYHLDGSPIIGCTSPVARSIYGFNGDMGQRLSCTITEHGTTRTIGFTVTARTSDGTMLGLSLANAAVPIGGGAPSGTSQFSWTDGNTYGGNGGASAPSMTQPCQVSRVSFLTDTATGLPLMDVLVRCADAQTIPDVGPTGLRSVSGAGNMPGDDMRPMTIHFYSCPVVVR